MPARAPALPDAPSPLPPHSQPSTDNHPLATLHWHRRFDVVSIDEGQFFPDVVEFAERCANAGKVVIIAALDGDFRRKPFGA